MTETELFCLLKEKHGKGGFELFVEEKIVPLAGDVIFENMGLDAPRLEELAKEVDIIVNGAATTNFYERSAPKFIYNSACASSPRSVPISRCSSMFLPVSTFFHFLSRKMLNC